MLLRFAKQAAKRWLLARGVEVRIVRPDGTERILRGQARTEVDESGRPFRMVGTVQEITETKQAEREHRIAETLQRSLLPDRLPEIPGVTLAARYVPATADMEVGGDWYDVVPLPDGHLGLAIGDVAGHGLRAASTMGQLRMALDQYTGVAPVHFYPVAGALLIYLLLLGPGEYFLLLNSDAWAVGDAVERLAAFADSQPEAAVVGPRLLNPDGSLQRTVRGFPTLWRQQKHFSIPHFAAVALA